MSFFKYFKFLFFIGLLEISLPIFSQQLNQKETDTKSPSEILSGKCTRGGLNSGEFTVPYQYAYSHYGVDSTTLDIIKSQVEDFTVSIIMATWCDDSKVQVPRFLKILDYLQLPEKNISIFCVNRLKTSKYMETESYKIEKVPTFIIYKNTFEVGRIIESPKTTLEKDLLQILLK